jgi:hypothetical protein
MPEELVRACVAEHLWSEGRAWDASCVRHITADVLLGLCPLHACVPAQAPLSTGNLQGLQWLQQPSNR